MAIRKTSAYAILSNRDASAGNSKIADIPDTPTIGTATAGAESATVTYTAALTGGTATTFTALSNPGSITGTGSSPITVSGLTASTEYTFTIKAGNTTGDSAYSSASNSITTIASVYAAYESIATVTLSGNSNSIDFTSIPSTYKHLQIRGIGAGSDNTNVRMRFNSDTSTNYSWHTLAGGAGYGSTPVAGVGISDTSLAIYDQQLGGTTYFNTFIFDVLDYTSVNKNKTIRTLSGVNNASGGFIYQNSGVWRKTPEAITSISIYPFSNYFQSGTKFALYGIKG